eukprot:TRINITY_DN22100_c0_g1_i1.p1 TRINITY_DN22100_c0_g1~~TRINITY_DN22100_c0_g1_i1.p1  ORF type:complete len:138 (-),score=51.91 TRINITY_DN22100_c0_g1_i1:309-722(-)
MSDLSNEQINELKEVWDHFDKGKKGSLEQNDFKVLMKAIGEEDFSLAASGSVSYNSFLADRQQKWAKQQSGDVLKQAFRVLDRQGNGTVSVEELKYLLTTYGEKLSQSEVNEMVAEGGGGASLNYNQLVDNMQRKKN